MGNCRNYVLHSVAAWLFAGAAICPSARSDDGLKPIHWKQTVFSIPYQINRPSDAEDAPVKVLLLVSQDAGVNWKTLESADPMVKGFIYNADGDGEYWFAVQTIDRFGRFHPAVDQVRPELHVIVDTQPPKLDVTAEAGAHGELVIQCRSDDPHLAWESLSVGARPQDGQFQPIAVSARDASATERSAAVRQATYAPPLGTRHVQIRAEITDLAGNRSVSQVEVDLLAARQRPIEPGLPTADGTSSAGLLPSQPLPGQGQSREVTDGQRVAAGQNAWIPVRSGTYPSTSLGHDAHARGLVPDPPGLAGGGLQNGRDATAQPWPVDDVALAPPGSNRPLATAGPASDQTSPQQTARYEALPPPQDGSKPSWSARPASSVRTGPAAGDLMTLPLAGPALPNGAATPPPVEALPAGETASAAITPEEIPPGEPITPGIGGGRYGGSPYPDTGAPMVNAAWPAAAEHAEPEHESGPSSPGAQLVNSRTIAIDYELDSVGPWGVSAVELWGTRDGGQTWRRYAVDDDNRSPVTATVEGEGDYGFRVLVHSAGGFSASPPQPGELPEVLVRVDLVRPEAAIESVRQGAGHAADQILIRWIADDAALGPNPISLYFSPHPAGPWSIIAAGLPNSGSYSWRAERHLPEQLYVRLEVRDAAGNVTTFQQAQPVVVQRPRPQVRIRDVRPFSSDGRE